MITNNNDNNYVFIYVFMFWIMNILSMDINPQKEISTITIFLFKRPQTIGTWNQTLTDESPFFVAKPFK